MPPKFQRTKYRAYVKLGSKQKSKLKYKRAKGRHNKTRQKWRGRPPMVEIGYKNNTKTRGLIQNKIPILISNLAELAKVTKENIIVIGKIGMKSKIEIVKEIQKRNLETANLNINKFMKECARELKFRKKDSKIKTTTEKEDKTKEVKENKEEKK
jgi:large subunit ribosomal protein L32e